MKYDYVFAGSGCAGLSLLFRISKDSYFKDKKILLLDKSKKSENDRTWCFWEKKDGLFQSIVYKEWDKLVFKSDAFSNEMLISPYRYKMIKGSSFYEHTLSEIKKNPNIEIKREEVLSIRVSGNQSYTKTNLEEYQSNYVFNSTTLFFPQMNQKNTLLQHFMGWVVKTEENKFDDNVGTLMDFSISQEKGITFMYVLPTSKNEALIEYTLFSEELLEDEEYTHALNGYMSNVLRIENYEITHEESGAIPMSLAKFPLHHKEKVFHIGTAGGYTKPSTGYTFQFIQKVSEELFFQLKKGESPRLKKSLREKVFDWYDYTLLDVLLEKRLTGKTVFSNIFQKVPPNIVLAFLGNESSTLENFKVKLSLPSLPFILSGSKQFLRMIKG